MLFFRLRLDLPCFLFTWGFPTKLCIHLFPPPHSWHALPSCSPLFDYHNDIWPVQIMKILVMQFSAVTFYLISVRPKWLTLHPLFQHTRVLCFLSFWQALLRTSRLQNNRRRSCCPRVGLRPLGCWDCGFESCRGMDVLCMVRYKSLSRADHSSRGDLLSVVFSLSVIAEPHNKRPWHGIDPNRHGKRSRMWDDIIVLRFLFFVILVSRHFGRSGNKNILT